MELVNKETVSLVVVVSLFLYALMRITKGFNRFIENHMGRCAESLNKNTEIVARNTMATTRVADALNQIAFRMPNYGCSKYMNNSSSNINEENEEVASDGY